MHAYPSNAGMSGHFVTSDNIFDKFDVKIWSAISRCVERGHWLPLLKDVDCRTSFTNLRLISNLSYIPKLTEKAVVQQLNKYLSIYTRTLSKAPISLPQAS